MNSKDFTCNTCGDVADFSYRLCRLCANEQLGKSLTIHNNSEFDRTDVEVKRTVRQHFLKHATEDVSVPDDILPPPPAVIGKEAGLSVDDPAKLAALTEADFDDIDNLIPTPHGMIL